MKKEKSKYLTTGQRRSALMLAYNDRDWMEKVNAMSNKQVYAIFDSLRKSGKIAYDDEGNLIFRSDDEVKKLKEARQGYHQVTLDEFLKEEEFKERKSYRKDKEQNKWVN